MSRSRASRYRRCPIFTPNKKKANRRVRRTPDIPDGTAYKRVFCSYEICDGGKARLIPDDREWSEELRRK